MHTRWLEAAARTTSVECTVFCQYLRVFNSIITVVTFLTTCHFRCSIQTQSTLIHFKSILIVNRGMLNGVSRTGTSYMVSAGPLACTQHFGSAPGPMTVVSALGDDLNQIVAKNY